MLHHRSGHRGPLKVGLFFGVLVGLVWPLCRDRGTVDLLAGWEEALSALSIRVEIDGREHFGCSSAGGDSGGCGTRFAGIEEKYEGI